MEGRNVEHLLSPSSHTHTIIFLYCIIKFNFFFTYKSFLIFFLLLFTKHQKDIDLVLLYRQAHFFPPKNRKEKTNNIFYNNYRFSFLFLVDGLKYIHFCYRYILYTATKEVAKLTLALITHLFNFFLVLKLNIICFSFLFFSLSLILC